MNKEKLLDHLWNMHIFYQNESDKYEAQGIHEFKRTNQNVADVYFKLYQKVGGGEFDV